MGLLRKLAELVVEFPEGQAPVSAPKAGASDKKDVIAAIEEISRGMESGTATSFEHSATPVTSPGQQASSTASAGTAAEPGSGIKLPVILSVGQVYEKALIKPDAEGFDISKVEQMLANPEIADLPVEIRARSVKMALTSMGKDLRGVLEDAAKRDKALDDYLVYLDHRTGQVEEQVAAANDALRQEIEAFAQAKNAVIEQNKAILERARQAQASFSVAKEAEEKRLFNVVAPFVTPGENPVVISGSAPLTVPGHKVQSDPKGEKK
jgi:hypothetical protein